MRRARDRSVKVIQYGMGEIGAACARAIVETPGLTLAGAVDTDPSKAGQPIMAILPPDLLHRAESSDLRRIQISRTLKEALRGRRADIVLHTTQSSLRQVAPQIGECLRAGLPIVSSTEELSLPEATDPALARRLDRLARANGVAVLGAGVNPGFVMDLLPLVASGVSRNVRCIQVERHLDAGKRGPSFQRRVGVGLAPEEAKRRLKSGELGHAGLLQSALLLAQGCGLGPEEIREMSHPMVARRRLESAFGVVRRGQVSGLHQSLLGLRNGEVILSFELVMAIEVKDPHDAAFIDGDPPVRLRIEGGLPGDPAAVAALLNAIPRVLDASPGLHTLLDLPAPRTWRPPVA